MKVGAVTSRHTDRAMSLSEFDIADGGNKSRSHVSGRLTRHVIAMTCGSIAFGYNSAIIATTLGQPSFVKYMGLDTRPNASGLEGAMNALFYAGGFFGALFTSWFADYAGRLRTIGLACIIQVIAAALCAGSVNVGMFIAFRFFTGWRSVAVTIVAVGQD